MNQNKFAKRLRDFMEMERISKRELSLKIGVDRKSVKLWLQGSNYPHYIFLIRLARYFNVRIDYLLGLEDIVDGIEEVFSNNFDETNVPQRFYRHLVSYMEREKLTQYALSKKLNIGQSTLKRWLINGSIPEVSTIIKLAKLMNISIHDLLIGDN